jgi:carbon monoxide dehydrogenase subunit G
VIFDGQQVVTGSVADTWRRLVDPRVIRSSVPGLERLDETAPDHFEAVLEVKLPAINGRFTGWIDFVEREEPTRLKMRLLGKGAPGFVDGEASFDLSEAEGRTRISWEADVQVGGQVARLGHRMIASAAKEMAGQFFDAFARSFDSALDGGPAPAQLPPWRAFLQLVGRMFLKLLGLSRRT